MTKEYQSKTVRDARAEAKRLSKTSELSYQQSLDRVSRDHGHRNWSAMIASESGPFTNDRLPEMPSRHIDKRRIIHESHETTAIEDAAALARRVPSWALPFVPALFSMFWVTMFIVPLVPLATTIALACSSGAIVVALALCSRHSHGSDAAVRGRRTMATASRIIGWSLIAAAGVILLFMPLLITMMSDRIFLDAGPYLTTVISVGVMIVNTGTHGQKAMAIAAPDSLRPTKHATGSTVGVSELMVELMRNGVKWGLAAGIGGVSVLLISAIASMFVTVPKILVSGSMVAMGLGVAAAMISVTVMMAMTYRLDDETIRHRAARAQRLLKVSR